MNKNVLVTGAASGIGSAVCDIFLKKGHRVYGIDLGKIAARDRLCTMCADITDESALNKIKDRLDSDGVTLDLIINVAGIHAMTSLVEGDTGKMKRVIDVNLCGTVLVNRTFHPLLSPDGRIVIVTSEVASFDPMPFNGLYNVSKTALECYAQALRQELNLLGQRVISIRPGAVETPLSSGSVNATARLAESTVLYKKQAGRFCTIANRFMGKPMKPEKLAELIYRAAMKKRPRPVYKKHQSVGLILLNLLPLRWQCAIIKLILNR